MKRLVYIIPAVLFMLATTPRVFASVRVCDCSPENPTALLGLIGAAGVGFAQLRYRIGSRRK